MTNEQREEKRQRWLETLRAGRAKRAGALRQLPELAESVKGGILCLCPQCDVEIVSTTPSYLDESDAVIEVWDTPPERLRELEEQSIRLVLQVEREHWIHISVLFHAEGENRGLYGRYRHTRRPEQPVAEVVSVAG